MSNRTYYGDENILLSYVVNGVIMSHMYYGTLEMWLLWLRSEIINFIILMNFSLNNYTWLVATMLNWVVLTIPIKNVKDREKNEEHTQIWKRLKRQWEQIHWAPGCHSGPKDKGSLWVRFAKNETGYLFWTECGIVTDFLI